jgi:hypothetical protein
LSGTLTAETIGSRLLELSINGVASQIREGRVLHVAYDGAAFVIASDVDAARVMGETIAHDYTDVFIVYIHPTVAVTMSNPSCRVEQYVAIQALHGTDDLNAIRVHNLLPGPIATARGKMQLLIVLAEDLAAGDVYCDGTEARGGMAVYTASNTTKDEYLPGRMVYKRASWGN